MSSGDAELCQMLNRTEHKFMVSIKLFLRLVLIEYFTESKVYFRSLLSVLCCQ